MTLAAIALKATGVVGVVCLVLAAATLWLVFTEPVAVTRLAQTGDYSALLDAITNALVGALRVAARYL